RDRALVVAYHHRSAQHRHFHDPVASKIDMRVYLELKGVLQFGTQANEALGVFLLIWTIVTVPFVVAAFRAQLLFGLLFLFVFFAFLGGTMANLAGVNSAFGGYSGLISAAIGLVIMAEALMKSVSAHVPQPAAAGVAELGARSEA
ncbi:GPR1/FUN34/YaaH family transporter, partial [Alicyclobacillus fructus]|uniref:GPR1/FUN34/YaaH family transporter n=1 Tax=Alicyclobacillus fructus TaxID=2816082 RepID=UPI001F356132